MVILLALFVFQLYANTSENLNANIKFECDDNQINSSCTENGMSGKDKKLENEYRVLDQNTKLAINDNSINNEKIDDLEVEKYRENELSDSSSQIAKSLNLNLENYKKLKKKNKIKKEGKGFIIAGGSLCAFGIIFPIASVFVELLTWELGEDVDVNADMLKGIAAVSFASGTALNLVGVIRLIKQRRIKIYDKQGNEFGLNFKYDDNSFKAGISYSF